MPAHVTGPCAAHRSQRGAAGGSGRKSLARLATYVAEQRCFTVEISKNYRTLEFREDLKELYRVAGGQNRPTTFLFDETQIKYETFVEDINNILTSGEVPNLFSKDEIVAVVDEVRACFICNCCSHEVSARVAPEDFPFVTQARRL